MKMLVILALMLGQAGASDVLEIAIQADRGQSCAFYKGSFEPENITGAMSSKPRVYCRVVDSVGARCSIFALGSPFPSEVKFSGVFEAAGDDLVVLTGTKFRTTELRLRVLCDTRRGCYMAQLWNVENFVGFACDMVDYVPPKKPAPQAPPLLRKPDDSNKPTPTKKVELEVSI